MYQTGDRQRFISTPDKPTKVFIGGNVSLVWRYYQPAHLALIYVAFGYWKSPGYIYPRMIIINGTTNIPQVTAGYETAISWAGNPETSIAAFVVYNIQPTDASVVFGIHLEFGYKNNPLTDLVQIKVEKNGWYNTVWLCTVHALIYNQYLYWVTTRCGYNNVIPLIIRASQNTK